MTRKTRSDAGKKRGPRAKSPVVATATAAPVVEGLAEVVQMPTKPSAADRKLVEFYKKNQHVVPDSVRDPSAKDLEALKHCHGRVCTVRCVDCGAERVVNTQDAFQSQRCRKCRSLAAKERRTKRKAARQSKKAM